MLGKTLVRHLGTSQHPLVGPAVRLLLHDYQLDLTKVQASGPKGNVLKSDVLSHIQQGRLAPVKDNVPLPASQPDPLLGLPPRAHPEVISKRRHRRSETFKDIPLSGMRSTIARRLSQAKSSIPHSYSSTHVRVCNLVAFRKKLFKQGIKASVNDFIIKAVAQSLRSVPEINVQWVNHEIQPVGEVDVSVAVATPTGLITPIVFRADQLSVDKISILVRELAFRAKDNKLKPQEFQGGSFTISNLGMFGIHNFTAIINPPQTAILAVGGTHAGVDHQLQAHEQLSLTLCYDNRAIQEVDANRFLENVKQLLTHPDVSLSGGLDIAGDHHLDHL